MLVLILLLKNLLNMYYCGSRGVGRGVGRGKRVGETKGRFGGRGKTALIFEG